MRTLGMILAFVFFQAFGLVAAEYHEKFLGAKGELTGRKTAAGFGPWVADAKISLKDRSMMLISSDEDSENAWFSLPPLNGKSRLKVTVRCHSRGSADGAHIAFGFVPMAGMDASVFNQTGALWVIDRSDTFPLMYSTGPGPANQFVGDQWVQDFGRDLDQPTEHSIDYDLKTGKVTATVSNNGNTRILVSDAAVNWGGTKGKPIPLENLACFGISFYKQAGSELGEAKAASVTEIIIGVVD